MADVFSSNLESVHALAPDLPAVRTLCPTGDNATPICSGSTCRPQIRRNAFAWQSAGQCNAHCLMLELFGMLDHLVGLLLRDLIAQVTGAKPLQVHMGATGRKSGWKKGTWIMRRFNKFALALVLGLGTVSATALIAPSAHAQMGVVDVKAIAQAIKSNANQAMMIQRQLQQYQNLLLNSTGLPMQEWGETMQAINSSSEEQTSDLQSLMR